VPQIYNRIGNPNFAIVIDSILGISNSVTTLSVEYCGEIGSSSILVKAGFLA